MTYVKALFPIGKTQWLKWNDVQRNAFNEAREAGVGYADAIAAVNAPPVNHPIAAPKKSGLLDVLEETLEGIKAVADVAEAVTPVVAVAKTVRRVTKKKGK